jgi:hypothetical protein
MMADFYRYLMALIPYWWGLIPGGIFAVDSALDYFWDGYRKWLDRYVSREKRRRLIYLVFVVGILVSGFLTWRDENKKVVGLEAKLKARGEQRSEYRPLLGIVSFQLRQLGNDSVLASK